MTVLRVREANEWVLPGSVAGWTGETFDPALFGDSLAPQTPPEGTRFSTGQDLYLLEGPSTAPPGAITVNPGTDIRTVSNASPAGSTFYLTAGTHTFTDAPTVFSQIIPKTGNTYIGAPGAILDGQNFNRTAFSGSLSTRHDVTIRYLEIINFVCLIDQFMIGADAGTGWTVEYCNVHDNQGGAIGCGSGMTVRHNWLHHNSQYGFSSFKPRILDPTGTYAIDNSIYDVLFELNEVAHNGDIDDEYSGTTGTGNGRNGAMKFWDTNGITVRNNWVHDSNYGGIWADTNNVNFVCEGNYVADNWGEGIFYEISYNGVIRRNTLIRNSYGKAATKTDNFPYTALYISESGGDSTVLPADLALSYIGGDDPEDGNVFIDNYGDVTLWESPDRFCNSTGNTSNALYVPLPPLTSPFTVCNIYAQKSITLTITEGSTVIAADAGTPILTQSGAVMRDIGRFVNGAGIQSGSVVISPTAMTLPATASGTITATLEQGTIASEPGLSRCRWKTKNWRIKNNQFNCDADVREDTYFATPRGNTVDTFPATIPAARNIALVSKSGANTGAFALSPYGGSVVPNAIVHDQNNVWADNTYRGAYGFNVLNAGDTPLAFATWQAAPYGQDAGSSLTP